MQSMMMLLHHAVPLLHPGQTLLVAAINRGVNRHFQPAPASPLPPGPIASMMGHMHDVHRWQYSPQLTDI